MESRKHLPALDGLRAIAIAPVLVTHLWTYPVDTPTFNRIAAAGWAGVDLFFVLSGFLITRVLLAAKERPDYYKHFYSRRVRRITPAYYLMLGVVLLILPLASHTAGLDQARHDWAWYVTYTSNILLARVGWQVFLLDITWSLAVEEQFYLVWPFVVKHLTRKRLAMVAFGLIGVLPFVRWSLLLAGAVSPRWLDLFTPFRMDSLAAGALVAALEPNLRKIPTWATLTGVAIGGLVLAEIVTGNFARTGEQVQVWGHTALAIVSVSAIWMILTLSTGRVAAVLSFAPMRFAGRISYGLYLYHPLILAVVVTTLAHFGVVLPGVLRIFVVSAVTGLVAWASFRWYETPILSYSGPLGQNFRV